MSTIWDWSPVFDAANDFLDKKNPSSLLDRLMGQGHAVPQDITLPQQTVKAADQLPAGTTNDSPIGLRDINLPNTVSVAMPILPGTYPAGVPATYDGPLGRALGSAAGPVGSFLQNLGQGIPSILQQASAQSPPVMPQPMSFPRPAGPGRMPQQMQPFQPTQRVPPPIIARLMQGPYRYST